MKHILKLSMLTLLTAILSSCDTYVDARGHTHGHSRDRHHRSSGTSVNANVGASLGL